MTEFALNNVAKLYNPGLFKKKVQAVQDLSLAVNQGEIFGLIGPNGAGKSTTVRLLLGLMHPDRGEVVFRGLPLQEAHIQREIGYLPENPYLYDHLTLDELLEFCGKASGLNAATRIRRADLLTEKTGMIGVRKRPLRTFSKGMLQRAGICFALLHDPSVVIFDEPMSGLDPLGRKMVFDIITELKQEGKTVFFCSHILSDVERLCDCIGVLVKGRLVREFTQAEFRENVELPIHLSLAPLSDSQKRLLTEQVGEIIDEKDGHMVSIASYRLTEVSRLLEAQGIQVRATRSERISLESLFLQTVEEFSS